MKLALQSEPYSATGNIAGSGVKRSLGTPTLDPLHVLLRETAQNAWDARLEDTSVVRLGYHLRVLSPQQKRALDQLMSDFPATGETRDQLRSSLDTGSFRVLEISDYGTTGLGGPVRADAPINDTESRDFVNFFRNVGSPRDRRLGGGTYGYGKSASYRISKCGTILAYTWTTSGGRRVARFIGASIGDAFENRNKRYTGRHWWGIKADDGIVDPLVGADAHQIASALGLAKRERDATGTTLVILDPELEERTPRQAMNALAESLAWFFWPKMIPGASHEPAMRFELALDSERIEIPTFEDFPPLEIFRDAMVDVKGSGARAIRCERPIMHLGRLGLAKGPRRPRRALDTGDDRELIPEYCSHVALMRPAELVVRYLTGPRLSSDRVEYGGVFICNEEVEQHFADAEPPAHDDWVPDYADGRGRTFVRVALKRISDAMDSLAIPPSRDAQSAAQHTLAGLGDALGCVLLGQEGTRLGRDAPRSKAGSSSSRKPFRISQPEPFRFAIVRKLPCSLFQVRVFASNRQEVTLRATPYIIIEGGAVPVEGNDGPKIVGWLDSKGSLIERSGEITLDVDGEMVLLVAVSIQADAATTIDVSRVDTK